MNILTEGSTPAPDRKLTSVQAAQEYLDTEWEKSQLFDMDALTRSHLRRMMGFDFQIKQDERKLHVYAKEYPHTHTHCRYDGEINEKTIDKLVDACLRLKIKHEEAVHALR